MHSRETETPFPIVGRTRWTLQPAARPSRPGTHRPGGPALLARGLGPARTRAGTRAQRYLDAAFTLIDRKGTTEFTIQEVVDESGQSLRSFYDSFAGKNELVLALLEEIVVEAVADLRRAVDAATDPLDRLRACVVRLHEWCDPFETPRRRGRHHRRAISELSMQLAADHAPACAPRSRR